MKSVLKGYLKETRRPVYSALLVLPFFLVYHAGILLLNTSHINGADALIIRILASVSVHSIYGSALVLAAYFAVWQLRSRASMNVKSAMLVLCLLESICFALLLLFTFGWMTKYFKLAANVSGGMADLVLFCGAGIYEELVFRAFLLGLLIAGFRFVLRKRERGAAIAAALVGALLFSAFHYVGHGGDAFSIGGFVQRTAGGLYFSALFVTRGFGITAATHAIYDIIVGVILA